MGSNGSFSCVSSTCNLVSGSVHDYSSFTCTNATLTITDSGAANNWTVVGVSGNASFSNCTINGATNLDYPSSGVNDGSGGGTNLQSFTYSATSPAGDLLSYTVTPAQGGQGGQDGNQSSDTIGPRWGSGGGGSSTANDGSFPLFQQGGGIGGEGGSASNIPGGTAGTFPEGSGGSGSEDSSSSFAMGSGGGGGSYGTNGQLLFMKIAGNITAFSSASFDFNGTNGGAGGVGGSAPNDSSNGSGGGGGGGGAGGYGGAVSIMVHGTLPSGVNDGTVTSSISVSGGSGGSGASGGFANSIGAGPGYNGTDGGNGPSGQVSVSSY